MIMRLRSRKLAVILCLAVIATWIYQSSLQQPPRLCGFPGGPGITTPRVKLKDGRHLSYKETGVPRANATRKMIFVHGFANSRHDVVVADRLPQAFFEEFGLYIVSFDRPGYGDSDPDPNRTLKSMSMDILELADQLDIGDQFYISGFSLGAQMVWGSFKYIPHRLLGAVLIAPAVNYWWDGFPAKLTKEAFKTQLPEDQWAHRVVYYVPWLTSWWNTQKYFPGSSVVGVGRAGLSSQDSRISCTNSYSKKHREQAMQQLEYDSFYQDMIIGFGTWEFSPMNLGNPIKGKEGVVHVWQGDNDKLVPVALQRYMASKIPWVKYHEVAGAGHMFPLNDGMPENFLRSLFADN